MENQYYQQRINYVMDYIDENVEKKFSLDELAKVATFSKYHFHRIFKAVTGETLNDYVKRVKMEKIFRQLIINKEKSLTEIAFDMGYNSSANFSRDFINYYRFPPSKVKSMEKPPAVRKTVFPPNLNVSFEGIKNIPDLPVIYNRISTGYNPEIISKSFTNLLNFFREMNLPVSVEQIIGIGYDDPDYTPLNKCRYDACIDLKGLLADRLNIFPYNYKVLKGGQYAVFLFEGKGEEFFGAWDIIFRVWVINSPYVPENLPHLEIYLPCAQYKNGFYKANLCLPVKKIKE